MFNRKQGRIDYLEDQLVAVQSNADWTEDNYRELISQMANLSSWQDESYLQGRMKELVREHRSNLPAGS